MADKILDVEIVTPQKTLYQGKAHSVTVPGKQSPFQVLYNHAPIVSSLDIGVVKIVEENNNELFFITTEGFTEVHKNKVSILVENAELPSEIDIEKVKEKIASAKAKLKADLDKTLQADIKKEIKQYENSLKGAEKFQ